MALICHMHLKQTIFPILPQFDLIVGKDDSFFFADAYKPLFQSLTAKGRYNVLAGCGHIDLPFASETVAILKNHLKQY